MTKIRFASPSRPSPANTAYGSSPAKSTSSKNKADDEVEKLDLEDTIANVGKEDNHLNMNYVLMNPQKRVKKSYSVNILDIDQKVVERGFIAEYYDCGFHYAIHPKIAKHNSKPSKINAAFKDINAKIKLICHAKMEDRPSDESHPLYNIPVWPHINEKPDTSSADWENWSKSREDMADKIVKALQKEYVAKTSFKGTISAIYNKLMNKVN